MVSAAWCRRVEASDSERHGRAHPPTLFSAGAPVWISSLREQFYELPPADVDGLERVEALQEGDELIDLVVIEGEFPGRSRIVEFRADVEANGVFEGLRDRSVNPPRTWRGERC